MRASAAREQAIAGRIAPVVEPTITARLRAETRDEHEAIEQNRRLHRLSEADLGIEEYVTILARLAGFIGPIEDDLRGWSDRFPQGVELRSRLIKQDLLRRDIAALAPALDWETEIPVLTPVAGLANLERAWGRLYVLEGATVGGQILARALHEHLGLTPDRGTAFYCSYGTLTGGRWQTFKAVLNACYAQGSLDGDEIIAEARSTFQAMNIWLEGGQ